MPGEISALIEPWLASDAMAAHHGLMGHRSSLEATARPQP
jgi:hypothetical protein